MSSSLRGGGGGKGLWTHTLCINHHHRDLCSLLGEGGDLHSWEEARAGGSAFLSRGRMSPRRRKESWTSCVYRVGWEGMEMAGEQPGKQGSGGSMLAPTLSPSLARPSTSSLILTSFARPACIPF